MKLIPTQLIRAGIELAKPIYDAHGRVLVQKNIQLTQVMVNRLKSMRVTYIFIREEDTDDILVTPPIPDDKRIDAIRKIKDAFRTLQFEDLTKNNFLLEQTAHKLNDLVKDIAKDLSKNDDVIHYLSDLLIIDDYVFSHSLNVSLYTLALAQDLHFKPKELEQIGLGAVLHDMGKIFIPDEIINKPAKLSDTEFEIVKTHTDYGFEMLRNVHTIPFTVAHCAYQHHERLDGSGYPRGIKNEDIHPYAKIIGVADVFDAVTSNRVYRDAMLPHEGLEILYAGSGTQFDLHLVEMFKKTIAIYPNGLTVYLSDGKEGVVARQNQHILERPIIRIVKDNGAKVSPYDLDLSKVLDVMVFHTDQLTKTR
ncbi:metal-dependent phosphohydrolase [Gracilibacillus boraciitolerans JCM 21714]|uniref:Metal-dependent phosphohydrolase n=1 Tax=Gracilibacillus boraciitolerans JCM 21714 TaxID=1298598 RepID=W4VJ78_9BACI|nr:HD-GYP domain-containing protein [Gracilibacillus boraciitolerans]GAE92873.1 metal-dependent phosphohydrolase [Gracilibacillus boraciitolerans JCM 21714]